MKFFAVAGTIWLSHISYAQSATSLIGARAAGMGYASATLSDESSLFNNIGAIAGLKKTCSYFVNEVRPALPGANRAAAAFLLTTRSGAAGLGFYRFGDELYSEQILSAGIGNRFGLASLGAKLSLIQYRAEATGTKQAATISFGGLAQLTPNLFVGAYIINLTQSRIASERLPAKLVAGLGFRPDEHVYWVTEVEKDVDYNASWKTGVEYGIQNKVFFRTGFNLNPLTGYGGLGICTRHVKIDYAISLSNTLGAAHQASASYQFEKKKIK